MTHNIFEDQVLLLAYYKSQAEDYRMRHTAIWTEVQHYTWVLSVLLGVVPLAVVNSDALTNEQIGFLTILPALGFLVAILAYLIIRTDFVYYNRADARLLYLEKELGILENPGYLDSRLRKALGDSFSVNGFVSEQNRLGVLSAFKLRIRGLIESIFLLYAIAAICEIIFLVSWL